MTSDPEYAEAIAEFASLIRALWTSLLAANDDAMAAAAAVATATANAVQGALQAFQDVSTALFSAVSTVAF